MAQSCYCTYYSGDPRCHVNTTCWACAPGAHDPNWQSTYCLGGYQPPAPLCNQETQLQTQSCPINYSGSITQSRTKICPSGIWTEWQTTQNSCIQNPPTCQISTQTQTLSCQTGYVGSIIQTQTSTCPNPYGQTVWSGTWLNTSNTCVKSLSNPTNITSPISPISPANPTFSTSAQTIPSAPVTVATPQNVPTSSPTTTQNTTETKTETPKLGAFGKFNSAVNVALTQELIVKPNIVQYNSFPIQNISQELPSYVKMHESILMELLGLPFPNQDGQFQGIIKNTLEIEQ